MHEIDVFIFACRNAKTRYCQIVLTLFTKYNIRVLFICINICMH